MRVVLVLGLLLLSFVLMPREAVPEVPPGMIYIPRSVVRSPLDGAVVTVPGFFMQRYEVTAGEYRAFVKTVGNAMPSIFEKIPDAFPVTGLTYASAEAYARAHDLRIPSVLQYQAALEGKPYPWGSDWVANAANVASTGPAAVGSFPDDCTRRGIYDLAGNVAEWTCDVAQGNHHTAAGNSNAMRLVHPGSWLFVPRGAHGDFVALVHDGARNDALGFRCVSP